MLEFMTTTIHVDTQAVRQSRLLELFELELVIELRGPFVYDIRCLPGRVRSDLAVVEPETRDA